MRDLKEIKTSLKIVNDLENKIQEAVKQGEKIIHFGFKLDNKNSMEAMRDNITKGVIEEVKNAEYNYTVLISSESNTVRIDIEL